MSGKLRLSRDFSRYAGYKGQLLSQGEIPRRGIGQVLHPAY